MTTVRAEQGTMVTRNEAMNLSLRVRSSLILMTAGTLHPNPSTIGITACPCIPSLCIDRSARNAARVRYPESSRRAMKI